MPYSGLRRWNVRKSALFFEQDAAAGYLDYISCMYLTLQEGESLHSL